MFVAVASFVRAETPVRVVSVNVCTDQLLQLLAQPAQIASLSPLARDPRSSKLAQEAGAYPQNDGKAESIALQEPDLIVTGLYTAKATTEMLRSLGHRVEIFPPAYSLDEARDAIARMGGLLGPEAQSRADSLLAAFDSRLEALKATPGPRPRVAFYYALGNTAGSKSLAGDMMAAAGLTNIAIELNRPYGGALPLEQLILTDPDLILTGQPYDAPARATDLLDHPVLKATGTLREIKSGASWLCGTPFVLDAVEELVTLRLDWSARQ
ncbi:ABC transporter substrate-binding protein [Pacificoceanicola onchidii]|uniref:ABC transporter substrate-binding protein n=1 Tax=Pacificoceanicola onchidii TaxID=2562685 RepID=UPI0010A3B857|nr:ABC transporter substrate-binding protein [Pacificoceanicola onchidii]